MRLAIGAALLLLCSIGPLNAQIIEVIETPLQLTVADGEVQIQNVGPRGVVLLGATLQQEMSIPTLRRFSEVLEDADQDGIVTYKPQGGTPLRGIWVAIDCESGSLVIGGRPDYDLIQLPFPVASEMRDTNGMLAALDEERSELDLVVVRPRVGAWLVRGRDGGSRDADGMTNGRLLVEFDNGTALSGTLEPSPGRLQQSDVIAAIDTAQMEVFATAVQE
ncbi:MAG TPA: hypothetical protein VN181_00040 [Thermoanaerobaculia bacterium]|nr:hypothetical protein [Thermoanaerobaculia bacterium]